MFSVDITVKYTPIPLSVQKDDAEEAEALYQKISTAMSSGQSQLLELTCDKQQDKKIAVMSDQISAVIVSNKSGATASGRPPGFFALADTQS